MPLRVAVVGAGIGGAAICHFLDRDWPDEPMEVEIFERSAAVGGRVATVEVGGAEFEAGASIIHEKNTYMLGFAENFGLARDPTPDQTIGIFNGSTMLLETSSFAPLTLMRMVWRYGVDVFRFAFWVKGFLRRFSEIYGMQQRRKAFETPLDLVKALDQRFADMMRNETLESQMIKDGFGQLFIDELASGIVHVNYGQSKKVGAFVGAVAMAGSGASLFSIHGGNKLVAERLINASSATLHLNSRVEKIKSLDSGTYELFLASETTKEFDLVFVACPRVSNDPGSVQIEFEGNFEDTTRKFHRTVASFSSSPIDSDLFGKSPPSMILTTNSKNTFFNSAGSYTSIWGPKSKKTATKVFSQQSLSADQIRELGLEEVEIRDWHAYPEYEAAPWKNSKFTLDGKNLFHVNVIEEAASAMEMSCIGARNCVLLAAAKRQQRSKL